MHQEMKIFASANDYKYLYISNSFQWNISKEDKARRHFVRYKIMHPTWDCGSHELLPLPRLWDSPTWDSGGRELLPLPPRLWH